MGIGTYNSSRSVLGAVTAPPATLTIYAPKSKINFFNKRKQKIAKEQKGLKWILH